MSNLKIEHATFQIVAGSIKNTANSFILDRKTRGVSKRTIEFYSVELKYFMRFLDSVNIANMGKLIDPEIVRKYLLSVSGHRNKGGVAVSYRVVKCFLNWFESETDGDFVSPMKKLRYLLEIISPSQE